MRDPENPNEKAPARQRAVIDDELYVIEYYIRNSSKVRKAYGLKRDKNGKYEVDGDEGLEILKKMPESPIKSMLRRLCGRG